jgi:hypothetical protein
MITLRRVARGGEGTFGVLMEDDIPFALTCERPWLNNRPSVSSVPPGRYRCHRITSPRFGETFELRDVPGRTHILFHVGNTSRETEGCILVGRSFGTLGGRAAVLSSALAFGDLMERLRGRDEFTLSIEEV